MSLPPKFIHVPTSAGLTIRLNLKNYQQATTSDPPTLPTRSSFPTASSSAPAPLGKYPAKSHCLRVVATLHPELRNATYPPLAVASSTSPVNLPS